MDSNVRVVYGVDNNKGAGDKVYVISVPSTSVSVSCRRGVDVNKDCGLTGVLLVEASISCGHEFCLEKGPVVREAPTLADIRRHEGSPGSVRVCIYRTIGVHCKCFAGSKSSDVLQGLLFEESMV